MSTSNWKGLLFGLLFSGTAGASPSLQHCLDLVLTVPSAQCAETDKSFLPLALHRCMLATLHLIALLFQPLQKVLVVLGLFSQNAVDHAA